MKLHRHILSLLLAAMVLCAAAQPAVKWIERKHDFGVFMERDGKVHCDMPFVNTGNEPLLVVRAKAGCGCTGVTWPEQAVQPGDTASIGITYNPTGRPGQFTKQAVIYTNCDPNRTILEITGNVIPTDETLDKQYPLRAGDLRVSQAYMPFGEIPRSQNKMLFLSTYNASTDTMLLTVEGDKPNMHPAVVPDTVPPARVAAITVHYLAAHAPQWGLNEDTLTIVSKALHEQDKAVGGTANVNVTSVVTEDFDRLTDKQRADAPVVGTDCGERIDFGVMAPDTIATRSFKVTNRGKDRLMIRRVWVPENEGVTVTVNKLELKRGSTATVTVTANSAMLQDMLNVPLTVMTNDPVTPRLTVRLVGLITKD